MGSQPTSASTPHSTSLERIDSMGPDDDVMSNLSKEITDALLSYEKFAVPVFGTVTTIEATGSHTAPDPESGTHVDCDISFDTKRDLHLDLTPIQNLGVRAETSIHVHSERADPNPSPNERRRLRQQVSPWLQGAGLENVRHSVESIFRRAGSRNSRTPSHSADGSLSSLTTMTGEEPPERERGGSIGFRSFIDHASTEPVIVEEPLEPLLENGTAAPKPAMTHLGRLAQREAARAARKAEKALRKTASAGDLAARSRQQQQGELKPVARVQQREFHGWMGPDFIC